MCEEIQGLKKEIHGDEEQAHGEVNNWSLNAWKRQTVGGDMGLKEPFEREARAHIHRECMLLGCTKVVKQGVQEDEKSRFEEEMVWVGAEVLHHT